MHHNDDSRRIDSGISNEIPFPTLSPSPQCHCGSLCRWMDKQLVDFLTIFIEPCIGRTSVTTTTINLITVIHKFTLIPNQTGRNSTYIFPNKNNENFCKFCKDCKNPVKLGIQNLQLSDNTDNHFHRVDGLIICLYHTCP